MRGPNNEPLSYLQLAEELIPYVKKIGFTHIELLPVAEHPYEPSWGYQVTGYYSPSSRFGRPEGLMQFVDRCHENGIGVLLDWVAGHFPKDAHGLAYFDGTCLYEHADPRQGEHRDWGTLIFNYGRHEVENFLIANARFWLEHYHFDGLRVDAVASMLYLDYSRPRPGDWIPNKYGGRENLEAIEFLKHTNVVVHGEFPGVMTIAEESTAWPNVSRPVDKGGLGFGYKWNMGWMHDVLAYMSTPMEQRRHHHSKLTFGLVYAFAENYVLSLSHDEVVHMKRSLLGRMPGNDSERFANLRLLYAFMYAHPGKKLLFMGAEFGQVGEWDHSRGLEWQLLEFDQHRQVQAFVRDLNRLYRTERAFFESDFKGVGFEWLDVDNAEQCTVAFLRKAKDPRNALLFILNFSNVSRQEHRVGVPYPGPYKQLLNSNAPIYGGSGEGVAAGQLWAEEVPWHAREFSIKITLPALSAIILKPGAPDTVPLLAPAV
jgi:1,4-alpha-glucan branching enzyme